MTCTVYQLATNKRVVYTIEILSGWVGKGNWNDYTDWTPKPEYRVAGLSDWSLFVTKMGPKILSINQTCYDSSHVYDNIIDLYSKSKYYMFGTRMVL